VQALVAGDVPAHDEQTHPLVGVACEVSDRLAVGAEDSEAEGGCLSGSEPCSPRAQHVTLASDGQTAGACGGLGVATGTWPTLAIRCRKDATDDRLSETDRDAEDCDYASEHRQQRYRGPHVLSPRLLVNAQREIS
jgi:hypothetical protein